MTEEFSVSRMNSLFKVFNIADLASPFTIANRPVAAHMEFVEPSDIMVICCPSHDYIWDAVTLAVKC